MNLNTIKIINDKNQTAVISFNDLLNLLIDNFEYDIDVWNIQASVNRGDFEIDHYDANILDLYESMDDALTNTLADLYEKDKFNPKAKQ